VLGEKKGQQKIRPIGVLSMRQRKVLKTESISAFHTTTKQNTMTQQQCMLANRTQQCSHCDFVQCFTYHDAKRRNVSHFHHPPCNY